MSKVVKNNRDLYYITEGADYEGWLVKQSVWLREWRRRYFFLKENKLFFCKVRGADPHGCIDLKDCLTVKSAVDTTGKPNSFEIATPEATYYVYADTDREKDEWIGAIGRSIVRYSSAYNNEDGGGE